MNIRNSLPGLALTAIAVTGFTACGGRCRRRFLHRKDDHRRGGGHTRYTQYLAPFLEKHVPGNPNIIVQNMGGAGGTKAANFLYTRGLKDGTMIGILLSDTPLTDRPDVPLLKDLVTDPTDKKIAELMAGNMILGRGWLAPPGVPADRVAALRAAFKKALEDPEAIAGAKQRKMTWESAKWQDMQAAAERITNVDQVIIDRMQVALGLKGK